MLIGSERLGALDLPLLRLCAESDTLNHITNTEAGFPTSLPTLYLLELWNRVSFLFLLLSLIFLILLRVSLSLVFELTALLPPHYSPLLPSS